LPINAQLVGDAQPTSLDVATCRGVTAWPGFECRIPQSKVIPAADLHMMFATDERISERRGRIRRVLCRLRIPLRRADDGRADDTGTSFGWI